MGVDLKGVEFKGVPPIASYPLPSREEIPTARVPWIPDAGRSALLVHDMQRYFVAAFNADSSPIAPVTSNIARLIWHCRDAGIPVFYTAQRGNQRPEDRGLQADFWGPGMRAIPEHQDIIAPLQPQAGDVVLQKHRYSAFQRSDFLRQLREQGRDQLLVCGVYAQIGCLLTVAEAFQYDIQPFMVTDAVAAYSREHHDAALNYVAGCCGVCMSTDDLLNALTGAAPCS